jgi:hypothetical protein
MAETWDGEEDNEPSFMLDWATAERIAATDPVVASSLPISTPNLRPKMLPESPRTSLTGGESYSRPCTN